MRLREPQDVNPASIEAQASGSFAPVPTPSCIRSDCCIRFEQAAGQLGLQDDPSGDASSN